MSDFNACPANDAERLILTRSIAGEWADFVPLGDHVLRADFLRHLLLGLPPPKRSDDTPWPNGPVPIRVRNARIEGEFDLIDGSGPGATPLPLLLLEHCEIPGSINLSHARLSRLSLKNCRITHLCAQRMRVDGSFDFSGVRGIEPREYWKDRAIAWIDARGALIAGDVEGVGAQLCAPTARADVDIPFLFERYALDFSNCDIHGRVLLTPDFRADGGITFSDGSIQGEVWLNGATILAGEGHALCARAASFGAALILNSVSAQGLVELFGTRVAQTISCDDASFDRGTNYSNDAALNISDAKIDNSILLRRVKATGRVALEGVKVGGDLICENAIFINGTKDGKGKAIDAQRMVIGGTALFGGEQFKAKGEINLLGSKVTGILSFSDAKFMNKTETGTGIAIGADGVVVGGVMFLKGENFKAEGQVRLLGAQIRSNLECDNATFINSTEDGNGMAIVADNVSVGGNAYLRGEKFRAEGRVVLRAAKIVGALECDNATFLNRTKNGSGKALEAGLIKTTIVQLCGRNFRAEGEVDLRGADISTNLQCEHASFINGASDGRGVAIRADTARIGGAVVFDDFKAEGEVRLLNAKIALHLYCVRASFQNIFLDQLGMKRAGIVLLAEGAEISGAVLLREMEFKALGEINLFGAKIGHELECMDATFINPTGRTLYASNTIIRGAVKLSRAFSYGEISFDGAEISRDLRVDDAKLIAGGESALTAQNLHVIGSINFRDAVLMGNIKLPHITVGEALDITGAAFLTTLQHKGAALRSSPSLCLDLEHARIGAEFKTARLSSNLSALKIMLRGAHVDTLDDGVGVPGRRRLSGWGGIAAEDGRIELGLDGFMYNRLEQCVPTSPAIVWLKAIIGGFRRVVALWKAMWRPVLRVFTRSKKLSRIFKQYRRDRSGVAKAQRQMRAPDYGLAISALFLRERYSPEPRLEWLALQKKGEFFPQPYRHLARVLHAQGHNAAAREVAIAEITEAPVGFWYSLIRPPFRWCFGYGLHPLRACCSLVICILVGWALIAGARSSGALVLTTTPVIPVASTGVLLSPVEPAEIQCHNAIVPVFYAIDLMLPVIPLHQETRCDISAKSNFLRWQWAKFIFSILGKLVTVLALLTFSGVLKTQTET
jgi:hypothetical protein